MSPQQEDRFGMDSGMDTRTDTGTDKGAEGLSPVASFDDERVRLESETDASGDLTDPDAVLTMEGGSYWYGEVIAVNDVHLLVRPGITGLLGPNGAGKSTLMRMALGLARPTTGKVRLLGQDPWANEGLMHQIGYVPEGAPPWPRRTGYECVRLMAQLAGLDPRAAQEAAKRSLAEVGLEEAMHRVSGTYSQGMQQRLKFAIATAHEPRFLVLDEPLTGTDPVARRHLMDLMVKYAENGVSILISTHVLEDVEVLTDRIVLLDHGRLLAQGAVEEIRGLLDRYPRTVRVATPEPKRLGALLWPLESVVDVAAEEGAVVVHTPDPTEFHKQLQGLLLKEKEIPFTSVVALDDNVEAVFRYLVESR